MQYFKNNKFYFAKYLYTKLAYSRVGTIDYIAPEVLNKSGYNETVDWVF